ncbi:MAG: ABC transporter ATP-binding protein [Candidatus Bathyarchaeota archaeon]
MLLFAALVLSSLCNIVMPVLHRIAIDQIIGSGKFDGFLWWSPLFITVIIVNFVSQYLDHYMTAFIGETIISELRADMVSHLQVLSLRYFAEGETGRVMSRVTNDAEALRMFFRTGATTVVTNIITIGGILIIMLLLSPQLSIVTFATIPIISGVTFLLGKFSRAAYRRTRVTISTMTSMTHEAVAGMKVIQSFVKEDSSMKAFNEAQDENVVANVTASRISLSFMPVVSSVRVLGTILILFFGVLLYQAGILDVTTQLGVIIAFLEYQVLLFRPLMMISQVYAQYQSAISGIERMYDVIDTEVEVKELPPEERKDLLGIENEIRFEHVTFSYDPHIPVIKDVSFTIPKNKKVAIVGPTGAGKSTLINLLCRFYDPLEGDITFDALNLRHVSLHSLRDQIGIVLQDSFLFNKTVRETSAMGDPQQQIAR